MVSPSYTWRIGLFPMDLDEQGHLPAEKVTYDNGSSGLAATDVQAAIDELVAGTGGGMSDPHWKYVLDAATGTVLIDAGTGAGIEAWE